MTDESKESPLFHFNCPKCNQSYEAPEDMADTPSDCQSCKNNFRIPRPPRGFYADISEPQLEQAELYGIQVPPGMFRGQLKELITQAQADYKNPPPREKWKQYYERQTKRRIREAQAEIAEIELNLDGPNLKPTTRKRLERELEKAKEKFNSVIERATERKEDMEDEKVEAESDVRERAAEDMWIRHEVYESEFARGGDWNEFYRKPTRQQFDAVYEWLDINRPGWTSIKDITDVINRMFPELRK